MPTTSRGYPYPASTTTYRPHEDIQALAVALNTDVGALVTALGNWTSFTPTLWSQTTGTRVSLAKTVNRAKYIKVGRTVWAQADVTANANSSGGVSLALPFTALERVYNIGSALIVGSSPPASQINCALMVATQDAVVSITATNAYTDMTSTHVFRYNVIYEAAS